MARRIGTEDSWDDEVPPDDDDLTVECPHCGQQIYEESERCAYCEKYISDEDSPPTRKPWWIIVGVLVCLYVVYRWIAG
jgi:predicted RNA-binding Zn-ribbon protein involved in translation (DUF1610 family)